jgi:hypothetical protein
MSSSSMRRCCHHAVVVTILSKELDHRQHACMYVCMYVLAHIYMCRLERERHVGAHEHLLITACRDEEEATNLITSIAFERILRLAY